MFGLGVGKLGSVLSSALANIFSPIELFAAGEQGAWYDPSDFSTMFQDSAGTTPVTAVGQPVGLILDKSKGLALGSELITNTGNPFTVTTGWVGSVVTLSVDSGSLKGVNTGAGFGTIYQTISGLQIGKTYKILAYANTNSGGLCGAILRVQGTTDDSTLGVGLSGYMQNIFVATATSHVVYLINSSNTAGHYVLWGSVSTKELAGNHATQATSASRPVLRQDANSKYYLEFDGVDDALLAPSLSVSQPDTISLGLMLNSSAAQNILFDGITARQMFEFNRGAALLTEIFAGSAEVSGISASAINTAYVFSLIFNGANSKIIRNTVSGTSISPGTGPLTSLVIGQSSGSSFNSNMRIYSLIVRGALSTPQEITDTETWVNGKTGAY
jgi:hypothetical protein